MAPSSVPSGLSIRDFLFEIGLQHSPDELSVKAAVKPFISALRRSVSSSFPGCSVILGGSLAKGTLLEGDFDIDIFVAFPPKYAEKDLSDLLEPVLKHALMKTDESAFASLSRVHGSRDYFHFSIGDFSIEVVPVLKVASSVQARNVTDMSPLHVKWFLKKLKEKDAAGSIQITLSDYSLLEKVSSCETASVKNHNSARVRVPHSCLLRNHIRAAKLFCKSRRIYGAESYVRGFSGHVLDILVLHFGGFDNLLRHASLWSKSGTVVIDPEKHYSNPNQALLVLNKSKIGPLVVIDPTDKTRNAAASVSSESLSRFIDAAKKFLKRPSMSFFKPFVFSLRKIVPRSAGRKLLLVLPSVPSGKEDVVGAKLFKKFEKIHQSLAENGFKLFSSDWFWDRSDFAAFWFVLDSKPLPKQVIHIGPPVSHRVHAERFKKKYPSAVTKDGHLVVKIPAKFRLPEQLVKELIEKKDELYVYS
ncbi:hypothetical protein D6764_04385 [Candidatus Woesearchaeota archaeon]|nr:MAG: hypothetical protein D6764_04385 [Candidatus Woesearchaeota archaeon]